jgi:streptogramin lyase
MIGNFFHIKADFPNKDILEDGQWNKTFIGWNQIRAPYTTPSISQPAKGNTAIYIGTTVDKDGNIWFTPLRNDGIIRVNTSTDAATILATPGGSGTNRFGRGIYYEPSHSIYLPAYDSTFIRKYNIATNTYSDVGSNLGSSANKYEGGSLASNGNIYIIPGSPVSGQPSKICILNPSTDTTTEITITTGNTFSVANGYSMVDETIYIFNRQSPFVGVKFDTKTDTFTWLPTALDRSYPHSCLDPVTDNLWLLGSDHNIACEWDYKTESIIATYSTPNTNDRWYGITPGNNGRLYSTSLFNNRILEIDTLNKTFTVSSVSTLYRYAKMANNGKIYAPANSANNMLIIDTNNGFILPKDAYMSRFGKQV